MLYLYPTTITDALLDAMAETPILMWSGLAALPTAMALAYAWFGAMAGRAQRHQD